MAFARLAGGSFVGGREAGVVAFSGGAAIRAVRVGSGGAVTSALVAMSLGVLREGLACRFRREALAL